MHTRPCPLVHVPSTASPELRLRHKRAAPSTIPRCHRAGAVSGQRTYCREVDAPQRFTKTLLAQSLIRRALRFVRRSHVRPSSSAISAQVFLGVADNRRSVARTKRGPGSWIDCTFARTPSSATTSTSAWFQEQVGKEVASLELACATGCTFHNELQTTNRLTRTNENSSSMHFGREILLND